MSIVYEKKPVSIRLTVENRRELDKLKAETGISYSKLVNEAVEAYVAKYGKIKIAMARVHSDEALYELVRQGISNEEEHSKTTQEVSHAQREYAVP